MRYTGARLFPVALMGLLAALTYWLDQATQQDGGDRSGRRRHDPDYIVDRFEVRRFDAEGMLQHSLVAQKMMHYGDDDSTVVVAPRLTYYGKQPSVLSADTASLDKEGKHVTLEGHVHLTRQGANGNPPLEFSTSVLYAMPDDEYAHTDAPVTLTQGHTVINGQGLEASNKTRLAVMAGPVRGTIYPKQANRTAP